MPGIQTPRETFVVRIISNQNATWQGTISWTSSQKTENFRSALEMLRLIDSTMLEQKPDDLTDQAV